MKPIIDVSAFQGTIDWKAVSGNIEAAIIRLGYRGYGNGRIVYDTKYKENRAACEALGIPFSLYFFPTSITDAEAIEEADFIIREAKGMKFVLPIFLDSEYAEGSGKGRSDQLSKADRTRFLRIICERLQANGIPAGVYASTSWIKSRLDASQLPFSWWVAQWASKLSYSGDWLIWQYTSKGSVPGISGNVDCSQRNTSKPVTSSGSASKSIDELAQEVIAGKWGNGDDRKARLTAAGYDYSAVQARVNQLVAAPEPAKKTVDELAKEVLAGSWGNGQERKDRLTAAGYDYNAVQSKVNALVSGSSKSIDELAQEVIAGKWGNGSDRKARLTAAGYDYARVQAKVNKLLS